MTEFRDDSHLFTHELGTVCLSQTRTWERWEVPRQGFLIYGPWISRTGFRDLGTYKITRKDLCVCACISGGRIHNFH